MGQFERGNQAAAGRGRPRKADRFARPIAAAEKRIADWLPELIDLKMTLARGVLVEDINPITGERDVYQKPPDGKAIEYLIDRIMGKPAQRQEHSGTIGSYVVDLSETDDSSSVETD
jgi:hypothetical protein